MTFRLTMGAVFTTFPELADAQSEVLDHARERRPARAALRSAAT